MSTNFTDFTGRVNFAARVITRGQATTRKFDNCFECSDGDAVVTALYRRSLKNPRLAANLWRYICRESTMEAVERLKDVRTRKLAEWGAQEAARQSAEFAQFMAEQRQAEQSNVIEFPGAHPIEQATGGTEQSEVAAKGVDEQEQAARPEVETCGPCGGSGCDECGDTGEFSPVTIYAADCDTCGREFRDEDQEMLADMLAAHKALAHPEPPPTGTDGNGIFSAPTEAHDSTPDHPETSDTSSGISRYSEAVITAFKQWCDGEAYLDNNGNYRLKIEGEPRRLAWWNKEVKKAFPDNAKFHAAAREMFPYREDPPPVILWPKVVEQPEPESVPEAAEAQENDPLTISTDTLKALKLIKDAGNLESAKQGDTGGDKRLAIVRIGLRVAVLNVDRIAKWAALLPEDVARASVTFTPERDEAFSVTLDHAGGMIRFLPQQGANPMSWAHIVLTVSDSGEVTAPALPSPEEMKQARKELAAGRKVLAHERKTQKALQTANRALGEVRRAEEWAARLEQEARETIEQAEALTPEDCEQAVTLAKRVRDLRRLHRDVRRAAEDPQINTPEFFAWLTEEHKAAYQEAFRLYEYAAKRKGWHRKAETLRQATGEVLRRAWHDHVRGEVIELADLPAGYVEQWGAGLGEMRAFEAVFGQRFDTQAQAIKRSLRQMPRRLQPARESIEEAREHYREAVKTYRALAPVTLEQAA